MDIGKAIVGLVVGWLVDNLLAGALMALGVPRHTAKVVGTVVGALA